MAPHTHRIPSILSAALICTAACATIAPAHAANDSGGMYVCMDNNGRRITSDRYIPQCSDREQKIISRSGVVKSVIPPHQIGAQKPTATGAATQTAEEQSRLRRANMLLQRYPNADALMKARMEDTAEVLPRIESAYKQLDSMRIERRELDDEMAFYKKDPSQAPAVLKVKARTLNDAEKATINYLAQQRQELANLHKKYDAIAQTLHDKWR